MVSAPPRTQPLPDKLVLEIDHLAVDMPGEEVKDVSFGVREGEIFGIGGLAGQGKVGIPNGIMGLYPAQGQVNFMGQPFALNNAGAALRSGMAMVSEDRRGVGLLLDQSIEDNIVFSAMQIYGQFLYKIGPFTNKNGRACRKVTDEMIQELDIRCTSASQPAGTLSGGNQQKVCIARALVLNPKFLFVAEPTRGIDIGAKKLVLETLVRLNRGKRHDGGHGILGASGAVLHLRPGGHRVRGRRGRYPGPRQLRGGFWPGDVGHQAGSGGRRRGQWLNGFPKNWPRLCCSCWPSPWFAPAFSASTAAPG